MKKWGTIIVLGWWLAAAAGAQNRIAFVAYDQPDSLAALAQRDQKPLFLYASIKGCVPCRFLEYQVFSDSTLATYLKDHAVAAKLDVTDRAGQATFKQRLQTAQQLGIVAYPVLIFYDHQGREYHRSGGRITAEEILRWVALGGPK